MTTPVERMVPTDADVATFWEHVARYHFAAGLARGRSALDVACGEGYGTAALQKASGRRVVGVDVSPDVCEKARKAYGLEIVAADACALPFADGAFDMVVSFETIEHLPDPQRFLAECNRVCARGGRIVISTPNKTVCREEGTDNPFHVHEMDVPEFEASVRRAISGSVRMYAQCLPPEHQPEMRLRARFDRGFRRLSAGLWRRFEDRLHYHRRRWVEDADRLRVVDLILRREPLLSFGMNPFRVISCDPRSLPLCRYAVAVIDKT